MKYLFLLFAAFHILLQPCTAVAADPLEVNVEGVEDDALANVSAALAVPPGFVRDGKVDPQWLGLFERQAPEKVRTALQPFGFYKAEVTTATRTRPDGGYVMNVSVNPGKPVRVASVQVAVRGEGSNQEELTSLASEFPLRKGEVLLHQPYEGAKDNLKSKAVDLGYLDASFPTHRIVISPDRTAASVELILDTGKRYRFGKTKIAGAAEYPDRFLNRYITFHQGEIFSYPKLSETQLNLLNAERFSEVVVSPEREKAQDLQVPVLVQLKASKRRRLRVGGGYGTDTGARFTGSFRDVNMLELGHELQINLYVAQRLQGLGFLYLIPSPSDIKSSTSLQVNLQREDVTTYVSRIVSAELGRNRSFGDGKLGTAYVRVVEEDFTIGTQNSSSRLVMPGLRFTDRHFDDIIRPTKGYRYSLELRGAHQYLGSDTGLIQLLADGNTITPLPWRLSLRTRAKVGLTAQNDPLSDLPPSIRFFAGGDTSVRGYSYQSLGPRDAAGNVTGGKNLLVGSIELERDLFSDWGVSVFFDTGNAFNDFTSIRLFSGAGVGAHYYTRIGSINLYLARQIGVPDPGYHVHFTLGFEL